MAIKEQEKSFKAMMGSDHQEDIKNMQSLEQKLNDN